MREWVQALSQAVLGHVPLLWASVSSRENNCHLRRVLGGLDVGGVLGTVRYQGMNAGLQTRERQLLACGPQ